MHSQTDAQNLLHAIEGMCKAAGAIQMQHFRKLEGYEKKGAIDLLTVADTESEDAVRGEIEKRFPGHAILAEESGESGDRASDWQWVIDPIDGTTNYAHGMPIFCCSIAVQHKGETVAGGIYAPAIGDLYLGAKGHGATRNGKKLSVSKVTDLEEALIVTGFPYNRREMADWLTTMLGKFLTRSQGLVRLGSAALDLAHVAAGNLDGFYEANLHPWDMAAGALLVEEAGGRMSTFDGSPFSIFTHRMLASNGAIHQQMIDTLAELPVPLDEVPE